MFRELTAIAQACLTAKTVTRSDLDVMLLLAEADPDALPDRAHALLREAEIAFLRQPADRLSYIERLARLLETAGRLHLRPGTRRLTPHFALSDAQRAFGLGACLELRTRLTEASWLNIRSRCRLLDRLAACEIELGAETGAFDVLRGALADFDEICADLHHDDAEIRARLADLVEITRRASFGETAVAQLIAVPLRRQALA